MSAPPIRPARAPDRSAARSLRKRLRDWYRAHRRDLPWRRTADPYAIWVSEAMLQQTRVETVLDYWGRFLERFPDFASLAAADEDDVLAAWSGLGYYRRARGLLRTAQAVVELHGGAFPRGREALLALPGIGPYTAGAVLSIAFGRPEPLVDGNVARVFARHFELEGALGTRALEKELWELAALHVPERGAGEWNQALMELGATVCTARRPRCPDCPIAGTCGARKAERVGELPRPAARRVAVDVGLELLVVEREAALLLERRPPGGRMAGMWQLPTRETTATGLFPGAWTVAAGRRKPPHFAPGRELATIRHGITHHRIEARVLAAALPAGARPGRPYAFHRRADSFDLPLTGMTRKALARLAGVGAAAPGR